MHSRGKGMDVDAFSRASSHGGANPYLYRPHTLDFRLRARDLVTC